MIIKLPWVEIATKNLLHMDSGALHMNVYIPLLLCISLHMSQLVEEISYKYSFLQYYFEFYMYYVS